MSKYWTKAGNVTWGCTPASEACVNCYARAIHNRFRHPETNIIGGQTVKVNHFEQVQLRPKVLKDFAKWKGEVVFVSNMSDLFHPDVPTEYIFDVLDAMFEQKQNTYLILTKRTERMRRVIYDYINNFDDATVRDFVKNSGHIWFGTTAENQQRADERIPLLLDTPAAHRWISAEPLLSPINLDGLWCWEGYYHRGYCSDNCRVCESGDQQRKIDLVIAGGESGRKARKTEPEWFWNLYQQCDNAGVQFHLKQFGDAFEDLQDEPSIQFYDRKVFAQPFIGRVVV